MPRRFLSHAATNKHGHNSVEELWRQFFADPSQWWDHTTHKGTPNYPDFKHKKKTGVALWINGTSNPSWVKTELASMSPGSVSRSLYSWNAMIYECVKSNQGLDALKLYSQMQAEGLKPDVFTFVRVLNACANLAALEDGRRVHSQIIQSGHESDVFVGSALVDMYGKCGSIEDAQRVFYKIPTQDVVSWTAMLAAYVKCELGQKALELFSHMLEKGVEPNPVTFVVALNACASVMSLEEGRLVHAHLIQSGCESDVFVGSTLVDMYAKCGNIEDAERAFLEMPLREVVSWTAMLNGYAICEEGKKVLELFTQMQREGVKPNRVTFIVVLNACAGVISLKGGRQVHALLTENGFESDVVVGNTLVDMYSKCGSIEDAEKVFCKMPTRDVVSWNAMLDGYVKCEQGQKALDLFVLMQEQSMKQDRVTFIAVLNACASIMALEEGKQIHALLIRAGFEFDICVGNALVDMYAKCGSIEDAVRVFHKMPKRDAISWNAMLGGFAMYGKGREALQLFQEMHKAGVEMSTVTFICLLSACSHGGLVEEGVLLFEAMGSVYGISRTVEHYVCMVDLLGRAGRLNEAEDFLQSEPKISKDRIALRALLSACRNHGQVERGARIAQTLIESDPDNASGYVLLSNIYAAAGCWGKL